MPKTTNIADFHQLAASVTACGGVVPDRIERLLSAHRLLSAPASTEAPDAPIMTAALAGELTDEKALNKLLSTAANAAMVAQYRAELAHRAEHSIVGQLHRELTAACADEILDSLRGTFDKAAEQIARARSLGINAESSPEHILATGEPGLVKAWNSLDGHLRVVSRIGAIALRFGPRGDFPQIREYAGAENFRLADAAIMCCDGGLLVESSWFQAPDRGHRTSPWARAVLKLHSIESATDRYNQFAAEEFDRINDRDLGGWIDQQTGEMHPHPRPENPYRRPELAKG